jgi:hypothetical protein
LRHHKNVSKTTPAQYLLHGRYVCLELHRHPRELEGNHEGRAAMEQLDQVPVDGEPRPQAVAEDDRRAPGLSIGPVPAQR